MITNINPSSPTQELDFIWVGEYVDGQLITEYDANLNNNDFFSIDKERLIRFGLVGQQKRLFYEIPNGIFKLDGKMLEIIYRTNDTDYLLTGQYHKYADIITYKDAEAILTMGATDVPTHSRIIQYNFGYKTLLPIKDTHFNLKVLCKLPVNGSMYFNIRLVADKDLSGSLILKCNGQEIAEYSAPLRANIGGELNWVVE